MSVERWDFVGSLSDDAIDQLAELLLADFGQGQTRCPQCGDWFRRVPTGPDTCDECWARNNPLSAEDLPDDGNE